MLTRSSLSSRTCHPERKWRISKSRKKRDTLPLASSGGDRWFALLRRVVEGLPEKWQMIFGSTAILLLNFFLEISLFRMVKYTRSRCSPIKKRVVPKKRRNKKAAHKVFWGGFWTMRNKKMKFFEKNRAKYLHDIKKCYTFALANRQSLGRKLRTKVQNWSLGRDVAQSG